MYIFNSVISSFILFLSVHEKKRYCWFEVFCYGKKTCPSMWYIVVLTGTDIIKFISFHACSFKSDILICKNCWYFWEQSSSHNKNQ